MVIALWHFTWLSALGYAVTILVLGLFTAILFGATSWVRDRAGVSLLVVFPVFWTVLEWTIGHLSDLRFPWLGLGTSLSAFPTLVQIADVIGARGVTLLLALANTALALAWHHRAEGRRAVTLAGSVGVVVVLALSYGLARERAISTRTLGRIALVQPNVGYEEKWETAVQDSIVRSLASLSSEAIESGKPELVIWPEAAVPDYFIRRPAWDRLIANQARRAGTPLLVGGVDVVFEADDDYEYFNAAFLFDSSGRRDTQPVYHKQYLVPIVERVPFLNPRWFKLRWFGGFGIGGPGPVYRVDIGTFGVLICYESAFEDLSRDYRRRGADFIVNITNDAWFGETSAPYQHAAHLVMRAIENRVGIARAANTGISEFVDALGRAHQKTKLGERTYVVGELSTSDVSTLYTRWGDWVGWGALLFAFGLVAWTWRRPAS
jgi:apolipoprotein N-acyltransferase